MAWLRNGQELDIAIMHRVLKHLGFRIVFWERNLAHRADCVGNYTLRLESLRSPAEVIDVLAKWVASDWMWTGQHTIFVSCPSADCAWHYLTYTIEVVKRPHEVAEFFINEKTD